MKNEYKNTNHWLDKLYKVHTKYTSTVDLLMVSAFLYSEDFQLILNPFGEKIQFLLACKATVFPAVISRYYIPNWLCQKLSRIHFL